MNGRWTAARTWITGHPAEFRLGMRMLVAGMLALLIADDLLGLPQSYWAVLTAVIVMQASLGGALKASLERILGTIAGAFWGVAVAVAIPHGSSALLAVAVALALAPLCLLVAFKPAFRIAPVTAIIMLLSSAGHTTEPLAPGLDRVLEICVGSLVGLTVSLFVLPARAHRLLAGAAAATLAVMADQVAELTPRLAGSADPATWQTLADRRRSLLSKADGLADEAARERRNRLTDAPDPAPLIRTLRRLGQDMAMMGRVTGEPWDPALAEQLAGPTTKATEEIAQFFRDCGTALENRHAPPPLAPVDAALSAYSAEVAALRNAGKTHDLPAKTIERIFGLGFALDQLQRDLADLVERVAELAPAGTPDRPAPDQ